MADIEIARELGKLDSTLEQLSVRLTELTDGIANLRSDLLDKKKSPKETPEGEGKDKEKEKESMAYSTARATFTAVLNALTQFPSIAQRQAESARAFADQSSLTFSDAARIENEARKRISDQRTLGATAAELDNQIRLDIVKKNTAGLTSALGGLQEGTKLESEKFFSAITEFKGALNTEAFTFSPELIKAMGITGMKTGQDLEVFRKSTGLASMSSQYMANLINKNALSFQLYGNSFAKVAQQAEKMGISLQSVQTAAESQVMNVENTMDLVNQLNALGANIDFTELLRIAEFEGGDPRKMLEFLQRSIPTELLTNASTRALARGFQVPLEDILKVGKAETTVAEIEARVSAPAPPDTDRVIPVAITFGETLSQWFESHPYLSMLGSAALGAVTTGITTGLALRLFPILAGGAATAGGLGAGATIAAGTAATAGLAIPVGLGYAFGQYEYNQGVSEYAMAGTIADETQRERAEQEAKMKGGVGGLVKGTAIGAGLLGLAGLIAGIAGAPFSFGASLSASVVGGSALIGAIAGYNSLEEEGQKVRTQVGIQTDAAREITSAPRPTVTPTVAPPPTMQRDTLIALAAADTVTSSARITAKTEQLIDTLKAANIPGLTDSIKTAEKTVEINIDGQRATTLGVGMPGIRLRSEPSTIRR